MALSWFRQFWPPSGTSKRGHDKVDVFIVGAQKSATTALVEFLRKHDDLQIAKIKEIHFFDNEEVDWANPDYDLLRSHFDWDNPAIKARAEATPITMYWPNAMERLQRYNADARIIVCLRHPAYRAHSHWRMETTFKSETLSFEDAVSDAGRQRVREAPGGAHRVFSYIERGLYAGQVRRLQALFPARQILYVKTDDLWLRPQHTIDAVQRFVGLLPTLKIESTYIVPVRTREIGSISPDALAGLNELFRHDIAETATLTGLPLGDWLHPAYREPMVATHR